MLGYENRVSKLDILFGVEIEYTGLKRLDSIRIIASALNVNGYERTFHLSGYQVIDNEGKKWVVCSDASVTASPESCELVTPILSFSEIEKVITVIEALKNHGAFVDSSCGIHVHVSNEHMNEVATIKKLLQHDYTRYDMVYLATRGYTKWAQPQDENFVRTVSKMSSRSAIKQFWYDTYAPSESTSEHYNSSRYHALNLHSLYQGKGVEFRYFQSTMEADKIYAYIELSIGMLMDAINSYKMRQYLYVDRPYNKVYDRSNRSNFRSIAECTFVPSRILYKYSTLWTEYLNRMQISNKSKKILLENFA